jgi:hypothetical protein
MKRKNLLAALLMSSMVTLAGTVKSPNGNIVVNFSVDQQGRPTYDM